MHHATRFWLTGILLVAASGMATAIQADDWPQWRGPHRDGISQETGLASAWPEGGPKLVWQKDDLGDGYGAVSVADGVIYLTANEGLDNELIKALDAQTGQVLWAVRIGKVGNPDQRPNYPAARSTPTVDGEEVYVLSSDGDIVCLKAQSGEVVWQRNVREDFEGRPGEWAYSESPLVDGNKVVVTPGGSQAAIVALDKKSGETLWKAQVPGSEDAAYASVVSVTAGDVKQYVAFLGLGIVGVSAEDGKFLWSYTRTKGIANMPTPVVAGNVVYSATNRTGGGAVKLTAENGDVKAEEIFFDTKLPSAIGGAVKVGDHLYGSSGSIFVCADFNTGEILWQERLSAPASVVAADGKLYLHTEDGQMLLVKVNPEKFEQLASFTPPGRPEGTGKTWAYPAIADGKLYIRQHGTVWCFDVNYSAE